MLKIVATKDVDAGTLHPNSWNPNKQTERVSEATRESIATFGFVDPVTVRPHPDLDDQWEIIDGEHRWRAGKDLGLKKIKVNVIDANDREAKQLTIILNETRGEADKVDLAGLLAELKPELGDDLGIGMPYSEEELDGLLKLAEFDFDAFKDANDPSSSGDDDWTTIPVRVPNLVIPLWEQARENAEEDDEPHKLEPIRNGLALERILAEYIAGI